MAYYYLFYHVYIAQCKLIPTTWWWATLNIDSIANEAIVRLSTKLISSKDNVCITV